MELKEYILKYNTIKSIKRFNMETTCDPQSLGEHGYSVGTIFFILCELFNIEISSKDLFIVMNHDFAESYTGDLNKKIKDKNKETKEAWDIIENMTLPKQLKIYTDKNIEDFLGQEKYKIFELSDAIDAFLYCHRETSKGNTFLLNAKNFYKNKILDIFKGLKTSYEISSLRHFLFNFLEG